MYIGVARWCIGSIYGCYVWVGGCEVINGSQVVFSSQFVVPGVVASDCFCCDLDFGFLYSWLCCGFGGIEFM
jgi:hypothetical protein